jgi:hypothetical protein
VDMTQSQNQRNGGATEPDTVDSTTLTSTYNSASLCSPLLSVSNNDMGGCEAIRNSIKMTLGCGHLQGISFPLQAKMQQLTKLSVLQILVSGHTLPHTGTPYRCSMTITMRDTVMIA